MQFNPKDFRTKKIFVGGLPPILTEGIIHYAIILSASYSFLRVCFLYIIFDMMTILCVYYLDDFKDFFEKYGAVVEHQIMRDHQTRRSRGFGFVVFESEEVVDDLLANGNMIDLAGSKVSLVHFITQMPPIVSPSTVILYRVKCVKKFHIELMSAKRNFILLYSLRSQISQI